MTIGKDASQPFNRLEPRQSFGRNAMLLPRITSHDIGKHARHHQTGKRGRHEGDDLHGCHSSSLLKIHLAIICSANDPKKQLIETISDAMPIWAAGSVTFTACVSPPTAKTAMASPLTNVADSLVRSFRVSLDMILTMGGRYAPDMSDLRLAAKGIPPLGTDDPAASEHDPAV